MNIAVVLSGGLAKGAYQIGALQALSEYLPPEKIQYYSCSSIGALNGYAYATGHLDKAEQLWQTICGKRERVMLTRVLSGDTMKQVVDTICHKSTPLTVPFYCTLFHLGKMNVVYQDLLAVQNQDAIPDYLRASVAVPVLSSGHKAEDIYYLDGGTVDNIPVYPLIAHNPDYTLCFYYDEVSHCFENDAFDDKVIKIHFPVEGSLMQSLMIRKDQISHMIQSGYNAAKEVLSKAFAKGYDNLDHIYGYIREQKEKNPAPRSLRITGDMLVSNINKVTKKITKQRIHRLEKEKEKEQE